MGGKCCLSNLLTSQGLDLRAATPPQSPSQWLDSLDLAHGLPPAGANSGLGPAPLSPLGITPLAPH